MSGRPLSQSSGLSRPFFKAVLFILFNVLESSFSLRNSYSHTTAWKVKNKSLLLLGSNFWGFLPALLLDAGCRMLDAGHMSDPLTLSYGHFLPILPLANHLTSIGVKPPLPLPRALSDACLSDNLLMPALHSLALHLPNQPP